MDGNGQPVTTTTDAQTGAYVFQDVCQYGENFIVKFEIPDGFIPTGIKDNEFCVNGSANSNIDGFGESDCFAADPDGPDAGFIQSVPELATSVQIFVTNIVPGGNTGMIFRLTNIGAGRTNGSRIKFKIKKNAEFGTLTFDPLPPGWFIDTDNPNFIEFFTDRVLDPSSSSGPVSFSATFQHDGDIENVNIVFESEIGKGSGGDRNEKNNKNSALLSVN